MSQEAKPNRIDTTLRAKQHILSVYLVAGFPARDDTLRIAEIAQHAGADMLEIGIPFSDPLADGPTLQQANDQALKNGMTMSLLFEQLATLRRRIDIPVLIMGYFNPIYRFGVERFCNLCHEVGIDGVIVPDLPIREYTEVYAPFFKARDIYVIFFISPTTSEARIQTIDQHAGGFIYMVSSTSITGAKEGLQKNQIEYYKRIQDLNLRCPRLIGFGISNKEMFDTACRYASGAIVGSAFIDQLQKDSSRNAIVNFIHKLKGP